MVQRPCLSPKGVADTPVEELEVVPTGQAMELSYNSYMGLSSPSTTKLRGIINHGEVSKLIDSA